MLEVVTAVGSVLAAIGAIWAAVAAARSARAAENAALGERRSAARDIVSASRSIVDKAGFIDALATQLKSEHATVCVLTGQGIEGDSARTLFAEKIAERLAPVATAREHAERIGDDYSRFYSASPDDLSKTQARLASDLTRVSNLHQEMRAELSDLSARRQGLADRLGAQATAVLMASKG
jgi:hypothetical protein